MANRYTIASGLASAVGTWDGGASVPVSGDRVLICAGHTVTLDGTYEWGNDSGGVIVINSISTSNAITVQGTLKASRSVNSQLTCLGNLLIDTIGCYNAGTAADPIPFGVAHTCLLNKSSVMGVWKWNLLVNTTGSLVGKFWVNGAYRKRNTRIIGGVSASAVSAVVEDATGWQVGDKIIFAPTVSYSSVDIRTLSTITPGAGTTATITFAALTHDHADESHVGNFSGNITFSSSNVAYPAYVAVFNGGAYNANTGNAGAIHIVNALFIGTGNSGRKGMLVLSLGDPSAYVSEIICDEISGLAFYSDNAAAINSLFAISNARGVVVASDVAMYTSIANSRAISEDTLCTLDLKGSVIYVVGSYGNACTPFQQGAEYELSGDNAIYGCPSSPILNTLSQRSISSNTIFGPSNSTSLMVLNLASIMLFDNCDFCNKFGRGAVTQLLTNNNTAYSVFTVTLRDCLINSGIAIRPIDFYKYKAACEIVVENKNKDITLQEIHVPSGSFYSDLSIINSGLSSIRLEPDVLATYGAEYTQTFSAPDGVTQTIIGYLRKNGSYGSTTLPKVTISGLGITPVVHTMTNVDNTWEKFTLSVTQSSGADGNLTLIFSGQSANAGAKCWFDGIPSVPFVTACRHYGYTFDPDNLVRKIDAISVLSEAAANALTGISINYGTSTLTISSSHTLSEVYDYVHASLCATANLAQPEFFTSVDGVNFNCSFDITLTGSITGTGTIAMPANTLTVTGGTSTVPITHDAGVFTSIKITNLIVGSLLQLYNVTDSTELYYTTAAATSVTFNLNWTVDKSIRLRVMHISGTSAKIFVNVLGILISTGLSFLVDQIDDEVYNTNALDGSTIAGITINDSLLLINIDDTSITWAEIYAYETYWLSTITGMRDEGRIIDAVDIANFKLYNFKIKNVSSPSLPLMISGGYGVDAISGLASDLIDNTGGTIFCTPDHVVPYASVNTSNLLTVPKFLALK